ncbi:MAG: MBL fold metallo-hydrolase [Clostridia bacterium]|nr:MBL fold metallo-hydrolase [Clostridia bacterium]
MRRHLSLLILALFLLAALFSCQRGAITVEKGKICVYFLDVGEGDCILIRTADTAILVDTGEADEDVTDTVLSTLRRQGVTRLDCLVLTHPHTDHIGGASAVLEALEVDECLMPYAVAEGEVFSRLLDTLERGDTRLLEAYADRTLTYGDLTLEILSPERRGYGDLNDHSIVLRVVFQETAILLTGDATALAEAEILGRYPREALSADLLKVGHHGAETSLSEAFLSAVAPTHAVISCGAGNAYGHPHAATLLRLRNAGVTVWRTDKQGDIIFLGDGAEFSRIK